MSTPTKENEPTNLSLAYLALATAIDKRYNDETAPSVEVVCDTIRDHLAGIFQSPPWIKPAPVTDGVRRKIIADLRSYIHGKSDELILSNSIDSTCELVASLESRLHLAEERVKELEKGLSDAEDNLRLAEGYFREQGYTLSANEMQMYANQASRAALSKEQGRAGT